MDVKCFWGKIQLFGPYGLTHRSQRAPASPQMDAWCVHPTGEMFEEVWHCAQKLLPERVCTWRFIDGESQGRLCELYLLIHYARYKSFKLSRERTYPLKSYHWSKQRKGSARRPSMSSKERVPDFVSRAVWGRDARSTHWEKTQVSSHGEMAGLQLLAGVGESHKLLPIKQEVSHSPIGGAF